MINYNYLLGVLAVLITMLMSSAYTSSSVNSEWYKCIKPTITPPGFIFPIVWTCLYIIIGFIFSRIINDSYEHKGVLIILFSINLVLNILWCYLFFYKRNVKIGFLCILALVLNTLCIYAIIPGISLKLFLVPYICWLLFASYLNYATLSRYDMCRSY